MRYLSGGGTADPTHDIETIPNANKQCGWGKPLFNWRHVVEHGFASIHRDASDVSGSASAFEQKGHRDEYLGTVEPATGALRQLDWVNTDPVTLFNSHFS